MARKSSSMPQKQPPARIAVSSVLLQPAFSPGSGAVQLLSALALAGSDCAPPLKSGR